MKRHLYAMVLFASIALAACAQNITTTQTVPFGDIGSLTFSSTDAGLIGCDPNNPYVFMPSYHQWEYSNFVYISPSGVEYPLDGDVFYVGNIVDNGSGLCPPTDGPSKVLLAHGQDFSVTFLPQGDLSDASFHYGPLSLNPKYVVLSVLYSPPGQRSSVDYSSTTGIGTSTTITTSGGQSSKLVASASAKFGLVSVSGSYSDGWAESQDDSRSISLKKTSTSALIVPGPASSADGINHEADAFVLWLNPGISLVPLSPTQAEWSYVVNPGDPSFPNMDIQYVSVSQLKNPSTMPPGIANALARSWDSSGLGGLTNEDYATILLRDPFAGGSTTIDHTRFDLLAGETFPYDPPSVFGQPITTERSISYSATSAQGQTATDSHESSVSVGIADTFALSWLTNFDVNYSRTWTVTNKHASDSTVSSDKSVAISITGPNAGYTGRTNIQVYKDNVYGSFMFAYTP